MPFELLSGRALNEPHRVHFALHNLLMSYVSVPVEIALLLSCLAFPAQESLGLLERQQPVRIQDTEPHTKAEDSDVFPEQGRTVTMTWCAPSLPHVLE